MTNLNEEAVDSVDGSGFSESEYELAIENNIEVTGYNSDVPKGEVEVETPQEDPKELEIAENPTEPVKEEEKETTAKEVDADPFGTPSEDTGVQGEDEEDNADFEGLPKGFKKRLGRQNRKVGRLEKELLELKSQLSKPAPTPTSGNAEPVYKREHFSSDGEYIEHVAQSKANESVQKILEQQQQDQQAHAQQQEFAKSWGEKVQANYSNEDDKAEYFEAIASLGNPQEIFSEDIVKYMFQHENGPKMLRYFAERPAVVEQVNRAHAYDIPSMLSKISQFVGQTSAQVEPPKSSKAPAPTGSLTNKTNGVTTKSIDNMSDEELLKAHDNGTLQF